VPCCPRNAGLARERGTDPLPNFAGLGVTRPALEETRYFPPTVVGDRRAEVALGPAGGEMRGSSGRLASSASSPRRAQGRAHLRIGNGRPESRERGRAPLSAQG